VSRDHRPEPRDRLTLAKWHGHAVDLPFEERLRAAIQKKLNGFSSQLVMGYRDTRQLWPQPRRNGLVVERHHRYVLADLSARILECIVRAHGQPVVETDECLRFWFRLEKLASRLVPADRLPVPERRRRPLVQRLRHQELPLSQSNAQLRRPLPWAIWVSLGPAPTM
jgi:hypothetical protein